MKIRLKHARTVCHKSTLITNLTCRTSNTALCTLIVIVVARAALTQYNISWTASKCTRLTAIVQMLSQALRTLSCNDVNEWKWAFARPYVCVCVLFLGSTGLIKLQSNISTAFSPLMSSWLRLPCCQRPYCLPVLLPTLRRCALTFTLLLVFAVFMTQYVRVRFSVVVIFITFSLAIPLLLPPLPLHGLTFILMSLHCGSYLSVGLFLCCILARCCCCFYCT